MVALTIGLTGGIASGKSFIAARFIELGVALLEADDVARQVVQPGEPALAAIASRFGPAMLQRDGALDRRRLRELVFADNTARCELEAITHPAIRKHVDLWRRQQSAPYCIYSAAILVESGMSAQVNRILVVDAPEAEQLRRLMQRDAADETLARRMMEAQAPRSLRLSKADDLIDNADTTSDPRLQVLRLHRFYTALGSSPRSAVGAA